MDTSYFIAGCLIGLVIAAGDQAAIHISSLRGRSAGLTAWAAFVPGPLIVTAIVSMVALCGALLVGTIASGLAFWYRQHHAKRSTNHMDATNDACCPPRLSTLGKPLRDRVRHNPF